MIPFGPWNPACDRPDRAPDRVRRLAERTLRKTKVTFRSLDVATLEQEARKVLELYNEAWSGNWGFVPPSWEEFWHMAKDLKSVLAPDFSFVAEAEGEIVGFMLIARDLNRVLPRMPSGRLRAAPPSSMNSDAYRNFFLARILYRLQANCTFRFQVNSPAIFEL